MANLWIVGKGDPEDRFKWEFQGVFDDEQKARDECKGEFDFVGPATLNKKLSRDSDDWPGAYYPLFEE